MGTAMKQILFSTAAAIGLAPFAMAQDLPQAGSSWYQAGQTTIAVRLAVAPITGKAKNVILFTADGNGAGTNHAVRLLTRRQAGGLGDDYVQPHVTFPHVALVKTYSSNGRTPDSAPTTAAVNSGIKTKNGMISILGTVAANDRVGGATAGTRTFAETSPRWASRLGFHSTVRPVGATFARA
jgi:alkaline phosphatase